jgi:lipopolysaccharide export system permease protein
VGLVLLSIVRMLLVLKSGSSMSHAFNLVVELTFLFMPHYLGFILPFSLFFGVYTIVRRLSLNHELVSLFANGVSLTRFIMPMIILGVLVTATNCLILGWLEPWARYSYRELTFRLQHVAPYLAIREGVFTTIGHQTIYVEHIDNDTYALKDIFVFQLNSDGSQTEIIAARGDVVVGEHLPQLILHDGNRLVVKQSSLVKAGQPDTPENLEFQTLSFPLTPPSVQFHQRGDDEQEFSLYGLYERLDTPPAGTSTAEMASELNRKLVIILTSLFLPMIGTFLAQTNPRGSNLYQGIFSFGFILIYQQLVQFGGVLTDRTGASPAITIWPWFGILALASLLFIALKDNVAGRPGEIMPILIGNLWHWLSKLLAFPRKRRGKRLS